MAAVQTMDKDCSILCKPEAKNVFGNLSPQSTKIASQNFLEHDNNTNSKHIPINSTVNRKSPTKNSYLMSNILKDSQDQECVLDLTTYTSSTSSDRETSRKRSIDRISDCEISPTDEVKLQPLRQEQLLPTKDGKSTLSQSHFDNLNSLRTNKEEPNKFPGMHKLSDEYVSQLIKMYNNIQNNNNNIPLTQIKQFSESRLPFGNVRMGGIPPLPSIPHPLKALIENQFNPANHYFSSLKNRIPNFPFPFANRNEPPHNFQTNPILLQNNPLHKQNLRMFPASHPFIFPNPFQSDSIFPKKSESIRIIDQMRSHGKRKRTKVTDTRLSRVGRGYSDDNVEVCCPMINRPSFGHTELMSSSRYDRESEISGSSTNQDSASHRSPNSPNGSNEEVGENDKIKILSPVHLRKAKLMFFYSRYPNSALLKTYFPDIKFEKNNTAQLVKWFSNFREFFYIQIDKHARIAIQDGIEDAKTLRVAKESELFRSLLQHYNRNNQIQVPEQFREVVEDTLQEFFVAIKNKKDSEQSWKKPIYKVIARKDQELPDFFKDLRWMNELAEN